MYKVRVLLFIASFIVLALTALFSKADIWIFSSLIDLASQLIAGLQESPFDNFIYLF
jgi:hypothetical protein